MTAEEQVKAKWPDAYCNNWLAKNRQIRWFICTGVYQDQKNLGPMASTPEDAWRLAASRLHTRTPQAEEEEK